MARRRKYSRGASSSASLFGGETWSLYDSAADFLADVRPVADGVESCSSDRWCGGSVDDAARVVSRGDLSGVAEASKYSDTINDAVELAGARSEWSHDVVGAFPSVPAFLAGDPCNMWARSPVQDERGEISVFVNVCASQAVKASELRRRGVCVLAAVLALQRVRNVRLCVYSSSERRTIGVRLSCPLDVSEVCAFLTCPAVFRRLFLGVALRASIDNGGGGNVGWCSWSEVRGGNERAEVLRAFGVDGRALVLTPHKLGAWSGLPDSDFVARLNEMIEAVNAGGDLDA